METLEEKKRRLNNERILQAHFNKNPDPAPPVRLPVQNPLRGSDFLLLNEKLNDIVTEVSRLEDRVMELTSVIIKLGRALNNFLEKN